MSIIAVNTIKENAELARASWIKAVIDLMKPQNLFFYGGRGVSKSTDILASRTEDVISEMPGGIFAFTSDTYMNLMTNIIPGILLGWEERCDFYKDYHYRVDQEPPAEWLKQMTAKHVMSWKHTITTHNGCFFYLTSLDRPSSNAGLSVLHIFGDEAKYLKLRKLNKLFPTLRGDPARFGHSPYFLGKTFTSDMANPTIGEDAWMVDMKSNVDRERALLALDIGRTVNDIAIKLWEQGLNGDDEKNIQLARKNLNRWIERHNVKRKGLTFYYNVSSFANADILTLDYFLNLESVLSKEEFNTAVLGIPTFIEHGKLFYPALNERHFYADGYDYSKLDGGSFKMGDRVTNDCTFLRYLDKDESIEAGFDAGNMCSLILGQPQGVNYRVLKDLFTIPEDYIPELAMQFKEYLKFHRKKKLYLYHDRATNAYSKVRRDQAHELKRHIEYNKDGSRTGWEVDLMNIGEANIEHEDEYDLMIMLMGEKDHRLPRLWIDQYNCRELKSSLELAEMMMIAGKIKKKKTSEKLPIARLAMESTNMSDAFKYLMCRRNWLAFISNSRTRKSGYSDPSVVK